MSVLIDRGGSHLFAYIFASRIQSLYLATLYVNFPRGFCEDGDRYETVKTSSGIHWN